jgi:transcriptional regulator with GAF, ATPase, and Fis domain
MDLYRELFEVSKLLLAEAGYEPAAELLLRRLVETTGAERGFLVVREEGSFQQRFAVQYDRASLSEEEQRFSRSLVQEAIASGRTIYLPDLLDDPRFTPAESVRTLGRSTVLAAPLRHLDEVYGVVYLDHPARDAFDRDARAFVEEFAGVAGLFLARALEREALRRRALSLESDLFAQHDFAGIITQDPRMLALLRRVAQVAGSDAPVLIHGETGTGKELVARALHVNGARRRRELVTIHCAALPATLLESELFGHVAGAFTDARRDRPGRVAAAQGGTLFLDEIGEVPAELQAKLLRFLQFGEIQRLGSDRVEKVDVRVVAATHRDLKQMVRQGRFREDLYFRLKVLDLDLPPLRERRSDIPLLARHFLARHWRRPGPRPRFTPAAERALLAYDYPGNVRELGHAVERACVLAQGTDLDLDLLPHEIAAVPIEAEESTFPELTTAALQAARKASLAAVERRFVEALMARYPGNISLAARASGLHRSYLQRILARHRTGA